jgi:hypothetical protein
MTDNQSTQNFTIVGNNIMKRFFNKPEPMFYSQEEIYKTFFAHNPEIANADWNQVTKYFNEIGAELKPYSKND